MKPKSLLVGLTCLLSINAYAATVAEKAMCPFNTVALGKSVVLFDNDALQDKKPFFAVVNQAFKVKSVNSTDLCPIAFTNGDGIFSSFADCAAYATGLKKADYSFGRYTQSGTPTFGDIVAAGQHDSTKIVSSKRGSEYVSAAYAIDNFDGAICEAGKIYWQSAPSISLVSKNTLANNTTPIDVRVSGVYDTSFSKVAVAGQGPTYYWGLHNVDYGTNELITTTDPHLVHYPQYTGEYSISVTISDGTYSASIDVGSVFYTGGTSPPCTPDSCPQLR